MKITTLIKSFKRLQWVELIKLVKLGMQHLPFILPTYRATKSCMIVSTANFGRAHYKNGPANAFRHAYWNYAIAKACEKYSTNTKKIVSWTKDITDWHEFAFPNRELAKVMDCHNNLVGLVTYQEQSFSTSEEAINYFLELAENSVKIKHSNETKNLKYSLVHITASDER